MSASAARRCSGWSGDAGARWRRAQVLAVGVCHSTFTSGMVLRHWRRQKLQLRIVALPPTMGHENVGEAMQSDRRQGREDYDTRLIRP
jgi:hypothetical protein